MLALGSARTRTSSARPGTDLLAFFAGVFERALRRWLA
jgi:uncharacterized protein